MSIKDKEKWNKKYRDPEHTPSTEPVEWLTEQSAYLASSGRALDLAMGEGRNAIFVAQRGYDALGVDVSEAGVQKARDLAEAKQTTITAVCADLDDYRIEKNAFDLILCFYFLDRRLFPEIREGLRPGGLIYFETFNAGHLKYTSFKKEWVLGDHELIREFMGFKILKYREVDRDEKSYSSLVAQKESD